MRVATLVALAALAFPAGAFASPSIAYGIQDDAWLAHGPGALPDRVASLDRLGVEVVRFTIYWNETEAARGRYDWRTTDTVLAALRARGIRPLLTLSGTPAWANGGARRNVPPRSGADFGALRRRRGRALSVGARLVDLERAEPDAVPAAASPRVYVTRLLNPAYVAIHARIPGARVGAGETAPRANTGGLSPVALDPRDARRRRAARRLRPPSVPDLPQRDPVERRLRPLRDDHDGHARAAAPRGRARVAGRSASG